MIKFASALKSGVVVKDIPREMIQAIMIADSTNFQEFLRM
jgi:hypothetical protein